MKSIYSHLIIHFDEISLKGKNQDFFIRQLIKNIVRALRGLNLNEKSSFFVCGKYSDYIDGEQLINIGFGFSYSF